MLFRKKKNYEMNIDTANAILQNVFAAEAKAPNTIPFDKLVLREKANTRFYDRALILLFYWQQKTIEELAEITGQKPTNVKVRLHRIRKKLYVILKGMEDE